jgi:hypothetical protein
MMKHILFALTILPTIAYAEALPPMNCAGSAPDWSLQIGSDTAQFQFQRESEMTIPHQTSAEGQEWPRALTLLSRNDTAIAIIDKRTCGTAPYAAEVLTQRGQTPILLIGCCTVAE